MNTDAAFAFVIDNLLKSGALLLAGTAFLASLRRASAANRHVVLLLGFATLLLLPVTGLFTPRWALSMNTAPEATPAPATPPVTVAVARMETAAGAVPTTPSTDSGVPSSTLSVIPWKSLFVAAWLGGALLLVSRRAIITLRMCTFARRGVPIRGARLASLASVLVESSGIHVPVRQSAACQVPLVAGVLRPVVILPTEASEWNDEEVTFALRHELGHVQRRDCLSRLVADLTCALYWMNPLVWLAARQLRLMQEHACDDLVLISGAPADTYAEQLVAAACRLQASDFSTRHALAMAQPSTLEIRVISIMNTTTNRNPHNGRCACVASLTATAVLTLCAAAQLRAAHEPQKTGIAKAAAAIADGKLEPQVVISARIIDGLGEAKDLPEIIQTVGVQIVTPEIAESVSRKLEKLKGVKLLATPKVSARSGQEARIEVGREYQYPTEWKKDAEGWKGSAFETKHLGTTLKTKATVQLDGSIELELAPSVTELTDLMDIDAPNPEAKPDRVIPAGHRFQPVISSRKLETTVTARPGQTILLKEQTTPKKGMFIILTADVINPPAGEAPKGEDAKKVAAPEIPKATDGANWIIPKFDFREATVNDCADFLVAKSKQLDPAGKGLNIVVKPDGKFEDIRITISLANVPVENALKYIATLANGELAETPTGYTLQARSGANDAKDSKLKRGNGAAAKSNANSAVWKKAGAIIIPRVDFRSANLAECVEFLNAKSRELDVAKKGINLVLKNEDAKLPEITLSLSNIPVSVALEYLTRLADFEIETSEHAILLKPAAK